MFEHTAGAGPVEYELSVRRWQGQAGEAPASSAPQFGDTDMLRNSERPVGRIFPMKVATADWESDGKAKFETKSAKSLARIRLPSLVAVDWNRDGASDLSLASTYALLHFVSRNFIENGYVPGKISGNLLTR